MANIVLDFLHNYQTGERRETEPANAYQYDEGHVLEAVLPEVITSAEIHYWIRGMEEADAYTPTSITPNSDGSCTVLGNIPNSYFETNGELRIYIVVTDGTASITTYEGKLHIAQRAMPDDYVDDDPDNDAVQIIAAARGYAETSEAWAVGQINGEDVPSTADQYQNNASYYAGQAASAASSAAAQASLAPAYDNTATYAVGDYCLHDGQLYECTTAIATAEAWTAAHWTAVTVGGELSTLKDELNYIASETNVLTSQYVDGGYINTNVSIGSTVNLAPVSSVQRKWIVVPCRENDVFTITGDGGENPRLWAFTDGDYKLLSVSSIGAHASNVALTASQDGFFISNVDKALTYALSHTYVYKALSETEVESKVDEAVETFQFDTLGYQLVNLFDKSNIESGKYVNPSNGQLASSSDFFASDFIDVSKFQSIKVSKTHLFALYKEDKSYLSSPSNTDSISTDLIVDVSSASYIRFSTYNTYLDSAQVGEHITSSKYTPYGKYELSELISTKNQIVVDSSGNGDYTSFTEAIYENVDSGVDVLVKAGTYNIVSEYESLFGAENVASMADSDSSIFNGFQYGIILRNRKVEFAPGAHIVCDWSGHTVDGTHRFSALRVDYNVEIVGLDLVSTHTFYAIHDDYGVSSNPYTVVYENCRVKGVNLTNANCIGGGCKPYSRHIINNCYFDNGVNDTVVRYHNTNAVGAEPEVYVSNSFFNNKLSFNYYGSQTTKMKAYVNNCKASAIVKEQESSSFGVNNVELYKWCNEETGV